MKIARFELQRELGPGSMGTLHLAHDPLRAGTIVLECIHPAALSTRALPRRRARMLRDARRMATLDHPNLVEIHEVGAHADQLFVAREFVEGVSLSTWLREEQPSWEPIIAVFIDAGAGLAALHGAGVVHRNFRPDNVLRSPEGHVKLGEFAPPSGRWAYLAPEQLERREVDARADQFAFCVALYEALFASLPFAGDSRVELYKSMLLGRRTAARREAEAPAWVRAIIERGLSRHPDERWPSMDALLDALREAPKPRRRPLFSAGLAFMGALATCVGVPSP